MGRPKRMSVTIINKIKAMDIHIHQSDRECYFWTRADIEAIENEYGLGYFDIKKEIIELKIGDNNIFLHTKRYEDIREMISIENLYENKINIFVLNNAESTIKNAPTFLKHLEEIPNSYKIVLLVKSLENYWVDRIWMRPQNNYLKRMNELKNVLVLWDNPDDYEFTNFIFNPKIMVHNYYNPKPYSDRTDFFLFLYGSDLFKHHPKKYRIGYHIARIANIDRNYLYNEYKNNKNQNLFFTYHDSNKEVNIHDESIKAGNFNGTIFNLDFIGKNRFGQSEQWYHKQFVEQTIHSDIEILYETFTSEKLYRMSVDDWKPIDGYTTLSEKTLKLLYLGKPFIPADPITHQLLRKLGFKSYSTLLTPQLKMRYSMDLKELPHNTQWDYLGALKANIDWLLNLSIDEWNRILDGTKETAEFNQNLCHSLLFNTSLLGNVIDYYENN